MPAFAKRVAWSFLAKPGPTNYLISGSLLKKISRQQTTILQNYSDDAELQWHDIDHFLQCIFWIFWFCSFLCFTVMSDAIHISLTGKQKISISEVVIMDQNTCLSECYLVLVSLGIKMMVKGCCHVVGDHWNHWTNLFVIASWLFTM